VDHRFCTGNVAQTNRIEEGASNGEVGTKYSPLRSIKEIKKAPPSKDNREAPPAGADYIEASEEISKEAPARIKQPIKSRTASEVESFLKNEERAYLGRYLTWYISRCFEETLFLKSHVLLYANGCTHLDRFLHSKLLCAPHTPSHSSLHILLCICHVQVNFYTPAPSSLPPPNATPPPPVRISRLRWFCQSHDCRRHGLWDNGKGGPRLASLQEARGALLPVDGDTVEAIEEIKALQATYPTDQPKGT
jgi:hypothetical protein